jgi:hypothetical protein
MYCKKIFVLLFEDNTVSRCSEIDLFFILRFFLYPAKNYRRAGLKGKNAGCVT